MLRNAARAMLHMEALWESTRRPILSVPHCTERGWSGLFVGDLRAWMKSVQVEVRGGDVLQMRRGGMRP